MFWPHLKCLISAFCFVLCSTEAFSAERGAREGATKVMIVVTDGESHDGEELPNALEECESRNITRYAIAVSTAQTSLVKLKKFEPSINYKLLFQCRVCTSHSSHTVKGMATIHILKPTQNASTTPPPKNNIS